MIKEALDAGSISTIISSAVNPTGAKSREQRVVGYENQSGEVIGWSYSNNGTSWTNCAREYPELR